MKRGLFILFLFVSLFSKAQDFEYQVLFEGIGDNREFTQAYATPQTILGSRGAFELGVSFDQHRLRGGLSYLFEFGSDIDAQKPKLTLYYQFQEEDKEFLFGAFPRHDKINFPLAMLTDTLLYYRPNIEGLYGKIEWNWGHQLGFVDWVGRQTDVQREQFMAGSSGEIGHKNLFLQNYILMFHNAHDKMHLPDQHIEDSSGMMILAGFRTPGNLAVQSSLKGGLLASLYRERGVTDGYISSTSFFAGANIRYKNIGIKSVLNLGGGHQFMFGDPYYQATNYSRTDLIWYFINHDKVKGRFNWSVHIPDWETIDQQQQLSIIYVFGK